MYYTGSIYYRTFFLGKNLSIILQPSNVMAKANLKDKRQSNLKVLTAKSIAELFGPCALRHSLGGSDGRA